MEDKLQIDIEPEGTNGHAKVFLRRSGKTIAVDACNTSDGADREAVANRITAKCTALDSKIVAQALERFACDAADKAAPLSPPKAKLLDAGEIEDDDPWPNPPDEAAFRGVIGEAVAIIEPHSEADRVALLATSLAFFGNLIGRTSYCRAEADRHHGNLFVCGVGQTAKGRKGSSEGQCRRLFRLVDDSFDSRTLSGLSSGEGLIYAVRDEVRKTIEKKDAKTKITTTVEELVDAGVSDKRAICVESEFAAVLKNVARERNTLSAIMRNAWDRGDLRSLTRNSPLKATNAHISILAHCTKIELRKLITDNDMANGLANRFLWLCWKRSKCLPEGGSLRDEELHDVADRIHAAVAFANEHSAAVHRDAEAREMWAAVYPSLSAGKPGLLGAATSRAEAQVLRLSLLYALLDQSSVIRVSHLESALALWQYAEDSARFVFGSALGDPTADAILTLLKTNPGGLTRTEISEHFKRNKPADELARALKTLYELGAARFDKQGSDTPGRPVERWSAVES